MWEVIGDVFKHGGVVAGLYFTTLIGMGVCVRWLVNKLREAELGRQKAEMITDLKTTEIRSECFELMGEQSAEYAEKLEAIQEKRVLESRAIVEQVIAQAAATGAAMERVEETMRDIRESLRRVQ